MPTIAKQATNQAVRFPVQFYAKQFLTGGDKSLETNPIYNGNLDSDSHFKIFQVFLAQQMGS